MGLSPVSFQLAVSRVVREMLWREALAGHLAYSLTVGSAPIPWVFLYSGDFSLNAQEGLECVETGWEEGEESPKATQEAERVWFSVASVKSW